MVLMESKIILSKRLEWKFRISSGVFNRHSSQHNVETQLHSLSICFKAEAVRVCYNNLFLLGYTYVKDAAFGFWAQKCFMTMTACSIGCLPMVHSQYSNRFICRDCENRRISFHTFIISLIWQVFLWAVSSTGINLLCLLDYSSMIEFKITNRVKYSF